MFPVLRRRHAEDFFEACGEVTLVRDSDVRSNVGYLLFRGLQQSARYIHAVQVEVVNGCNAYVFSERFNTGVRCDIKDLCDIRQVKPFGVVGSEVLHEISASHLVVGREVQGAGLGDAFGERLEHGVDNAWGEKRVRLRVLLVDGGENLEAIKHSFLGRDTLVQHEVGLYFLLLHAIHQLGLPMTSLPQIHAGELQAQRVGVFLDDLIRVDEDAVIRLNRDSDAVDFEFRRDILNEVNAEFSGNDRAELRSTGYNL